MFFENCISYHFVARPERRGARRHAFHHEGMVHAALIGRDFVGGVLALVRVERVHLGLCEVLALVGGLIFIVEIYKSTFTTKIEGTETND